MKKFKHLSKANQLLAVNEFEAQGLTPNLELAINAPIEAGNFDWHNTLQPYDFWFAIAYKGEQKANEHKIVNHVDKTPKDGKEASPKSTKKAVKKSTKKVAKKSSKKA